jgi:hypothetical protein
MVIISRLRTDDLQVLGRTSLIILEPSSNLPKVKWSPRLSRHARLYSREQTSKMAAIRVRSPGEVSGSRE